MAGQPDQAQAPWRARPGGDVCLNSCSQTYQDDDKSFRRAPSWRKKFRPKDIRGLATGSAETLPANFRVTSMASPSLQPKKMPMDGRYLLAGA